MNREDYIAKAPTFTIYDGFCKTKSVLENHSRIIVSVSGGLGMIWYAPAKRKGKSPVRKVSESTTATGDFLALVHEMHPTATIGQIREIITDKRQFIFEPEAVKVCDDYIKAGCANNVPNWR